jgi:GWxTD domain-containing protein
MTAAEPIPFVADAAFLAGAHDSTIALLGLSLENRQLAFQREGGGFVAHYRVEITGVPAAGGAPVRSARDQTVRVATFQETQRNEESVLYQDGLTLAPGDWTLSVAVTDQGGHRSSRAEHSYRVPGLPPGSISAPILVYQGKGRGLRATPIGIVLNPRGTLAYGGDTAMAYVEGYSLPGPTLVPFQLVDAHDSLILEDTLRFAGGREVESTAIRFAPDSAPLGELRILVGTPPRVDSTLAIVSFSQGWVVNNFDELVALLRYFPSSRALDSLRRASVAERGRLWKAFYRSSDPNPITPANEALDTYFARMAEANAQIRGEGIPGWRTDRGEVLVRVGEPDEVFDASPGNQARIIRWSYNQFQLTLYFTDETGFGRYRLTPASRAELERVVSRIS